MFESGALTTFKAGKTRVGLPGVLLCTLAKAAVGASVQVYLREGKTLPSGERSDGRSVRNSSAETMVGEEGEADSPAACGEAYGRAGTHTAARGGPCSGAGGRALEELQPGESPCCKFFLKDFNPWERPTLEHE